MSTKIFVVRKKWLIVVFIIVLLLFGWMTYSRSMKYYSTWSVMCNGRSIAAHNLPLSNGRMFCITIDKEPVYMEIDEDNNGKIDSIVHCENGIEKYNTSLAQTGHLSVRGVNYRSSNGDRYVLFDDEGVGSFTQRVWTSSKGEMKKEVLIEGDWTAISRRGQSNSVTGSTADVIEDNRQSR